MAQTSGTPASFSRALAGQAADLAIPVAILLAVMVVLAPVPAAVVDLLLAANLTVAVLALLGSLAARTPLELRVFPSFLLAATLVRLVLNIATTRLILSEAGTVGAAAAGEVVQAFSRFVAADNLVVGVVVFVIIAVIQFVVLTAGATRTSEVAARFTLDGLPGRQAAIDAEVASGGLSQDEARHLRADLLRQAEFYASMDGASRFVRGEAVASVVIVLVNLVGGFAIGVGQLGLSATNAAGLYARLTIGDGLASAVPSLLVSVATGLLLSRSTARENLPRELGRQLFAQPALLLVTAAFLGVLAVTDLPTMPLAIMAGGTLTAAWLLRSGRSSREAAAAVADRASAAPQLDSLLGRNRLVFHLGRELLPLVTGDRPVMPAAMEAVRGRLAEDLGLALPAITFRDAAALASRRWQLELDGEPMFEADLPSGKILVVPRQDDEVTRRRWRRQPAEQLPAVGGFPARWGSPAEAEEVAARGGQTFSGAAAVAHVAEAILKKHADRLLSRDQMARMLESLRSSEPAAVEQTVPAVVSVAVVQRTLQCLLREGLPIKPLAGLLEVIADHAAETTDPELLAERLRPYLAGTILRRLRGVDGHLAVVRLSPTATRQLTGQPQAAAEKFDYQRLLSDLKRALRPLGERGRAAVVAVSAADRAAVAERLRAAGVPAPVLAEEELVGQPDVELFATIGAPTRATDTVSRAA